MTLKSTVAFDRGNPDHVALLEHVAAAFRSNLSVGGPISHKVTGRAVAPPDMPKIEIVEIPGPYVEFSFTAPLTLVTGAGHDFDGEPVG